MRSPGDVFPVGLSSRRGRGAVEELAQYLTAAALDLDRVEFAVQAWANLIGADLLARVRTVRRASGEPVLTDRHLVRAAVRLADFDAGRREDLGAAIGGGGAALGAYLLLMCATGRSDASVLGLARHGGVHSREPSWLHRHLGVLDTALGPAVFTDDDGAPLRLRQMSDGTNVAAVVVLMRVRLDPAFALWLTTGVHVEDHREPDRLPFEQRFRAQQQAVATRIARSAGGPLGRLLGPSRSGLTQFVNRFTRLTGARFAWFDLSNLDLSRRRDVLDVLSAGLRAGVPVPLALDRDGDRRLVLALAADGEGVFAFDPAAGAVIAVGPGSGANRLSGALLPRLL